MEKIKSRICSCRCELEEIADELHKMWCESDTLLEDELLEMSENIQELADALSEWED